MLKLWTEHEERSEDVFQAVQILFRQREAMLRQELISNRGDRLDVEAPVCEDARVGLEDLARRRLRRQPARSGPREQQGDELRAIRRELEQSLVQQMEIE